MARKRKLPEIPQETFSLIGPVPVSLEEGLQHGTDEALGLTRFHSRVIALDTDASPETLWQTFFHEQTHIALWDGAAHQQLTEQQVELVCDVMGTYMLAAMQAGYIKVTIPRSRP